MRPGAARAELGGIHDAFDRQTRMAGQQAGETDWWHRQLSRSLNAEDDNARGSDRPADPIPVAAEVQHLPGRGSAADQPYEAYAIGPAR